MLLLPSGPEILDFVPLEAFQDIEAFLVEIPKIDDWKAPGYILSSFYIAEGKIFYIPF